MISHYVRGQETNYEDNSFPALQGLIIGKGQDKSTSSYTRRRTIVCYGTTNYRLAPSVFFFFFFFVFLGLHPRHTEIPWLGAELELQQLTYTTATATHFWAACMTYTTAHSNTGSLTHWAGPGIGPRSSWIQLRFVNSWAVTGTPHLVYSSRKGW